MSLYVDNHLTCRCTIDGHQQWQISYYTLTIT